MGADVIYLHGYFSKLPTNHQKMRVIQFEGIQDLSDKIQTIVKGEPIYAVIMTAAISDWVVDKIIGSNGEIINNLGKIPSESPPIIHFKKAPKLISEIKHWNPDVLLVGFKLEHSVDVDYLLDRSKQRMETWRADYVVANSTGSLYSDATSHYVLSKDGSVQTISKKSETAHAVIHILDSN
ncbi:hypothetical protein GCM10010911_72470 [Paenibacillus nasutitermitis]|uniref:DNA/pantothenate metabolism flavoprotein C-terminal domain-containing protein n=2 Tax=Paenibacillus nasutitermitis TaxID=1652958 RepID=A0A916ZLP8_9BACL|nr:hypothetical protein GCM10010911_72470 [Paenibacillus nasutitermitis]